MHHFVPVPEAALDQPGSIVGGECNMWTERAPQNEVMAKVFPRATGLAEVLWSGPQVTQKEGAYATFLDRLDGLGQHWAFMGVEPGLEGVPVSLEISPSSQGALQISVLPALRKAGGMVHFAKDGDRVQSCKVGESMTIQGMGVVEVDVMMRGRATGVTETFPVAGHLAAHQPLSLGHEPSASYTGGGAQALADGRRGSQDFRDGAWQAVQGDNMAVTVDLGEVKSLRSLHAQMYLYQDAWIFLPEQVLWSTSMDGVTFDLVGQSLDDVASLEPDSRQKTVAIDLPMEAGRRGMSPWSWSTLGFVLLGTMPPQNPRGCLWMSLWCSEISRVWIDDQGASRRMCQSQEVPKTVRNTSRSDAATTPSPSKSVGVPNWPNPLSSTNKSPEERAKS